MSSRRRRLWLAAALVAVFTAQGVWAAPRAAIAELRALGCCTDHCGKSKAPAAAARCCGEEALVAGTLTSREGTVSPLVSLVSLPTAESQVAPAEATRPALAPVPRARSAPVFLLTRSFRI